jgi:hypothetical protein
VIILRNLMCSSRSRTHARKHTIMELNTQSFKLVKQVPGSYETFRVLDPTSTMVLYSKRGMPIASLTLRTKDASCATLITARDKPLHANAADTAYFQGMLQKPDQLFVFAVTNLCTEGLIQFNITPEKGGQSINVINVIRVGETVDIEVDQRTGRKMILAGQTKASIPGGPEIALSVAEVEATETTRVDK